MIKFGKTASLILGGALLLSLCACGNADITPITTPFDTPVQSEISTSSDNTSTSTSTEAKQPDVQASSVDSGTSVDDFLPNDSRVGQREVIADVTNCQDAYTKIIKDMTTDLTLPLMGSFKSESFAGWGSSMYAIADIDKDSKDELIICYTDDCVAGHIGVIYDYDEATQSVYLELTDYPAFIFYDNGAVGGMWSHNQGCGGSFYPYNLYQYNSETDCYDYLGSIDAYDKAFGEACNNEGPFKDNPFPADVDVDNNGFVYYIDSVGMSSETPVDDDVYQAWASKATNGSAEVAVNFTVIAP